MNLRQPQCETDAATNAYSSSSSSRASATNHGAGSIDEPHFVGHSAAHLAALRDAARYAEHEHATILIEGESGTGKSYVAKHVHLRSARAKRGFHQATLSTLDDNLAGSDLFGHISGAYTDARQSRLGYFATANHGTLFLDEIGKASAAVQRKLLHVIEHREISPLGSDRPIRLDVRLVAASNIALEVLVAKGTFLEDLAARLMTFRVRLPALRERREDIPDLVRQFVRSRASQFGHMARPPRVDPALMMALQNADWPYNLRQLDGTVQRLLIEADGGHELRLAHCVGDLDRLLESRGGRKAALTPALVFERMNELGSVTATARSLGVSRWTVYRYLERARNIALAAERLRSGKIPDAKAVS